MAVIVPVPNLDAIALNFRRKSLDTTIRLDLLLEYPP